MTGLVNAYQARHDGASAGGQLIADDVGALPDEAYLQAYSDAYLAKYAVKPPETPATPSTSEPDTNTPGRLAASAGEGVARSVWELGRTVREIADFIATNSPLVNIEGEPVTPDNLKPSGVHIPDPGPMPDLVQNKGKLETFVSGTAQFMGPFVAISKLLAGAKLFDAVGKSGVAKSLAKNAALSAPVDFAAFDPIENNLFKIAKESGFEQELKDYLGSDTVESLLPGMGKSSETALANRIKAALVNAPVGTAMGATVEGLLFTAKALKHVRAYAGEIGPGPIAAQKGMVAFHGSPHTFDKFDKTKIGTGEGASAYGHGLYFSENPEIAGGYHERLAGEPELEKLTIGSKPLKRGEKWLDYGPRNNSDEESVLSSFAEDVLIDDSGLRAAYSTGGEKGAQEFVVKKLDERIANYYDPEHDQSLIAAAKTLRKKLMLPGAVKMKVGEATGGLYTVDIPDEVVDKMLHWDQPLNEQTPAIRKAVKPLTQFLGLDKDATGQQVYETLARKIATTQGVDEQTAWKMAADALDKAGVPGIKYKDAGSRSASGDTHNLVLFDDKHAKVLKRNDKPIEPAKPEPQGEDPKALRDMLEQVLTAVAAQGKASGAKLAAGTTIEVASRDETGRAKTFKIVEA